MKAENMAKLMSASATLTGMLEEGDGKCSGAFTCYLYEFLEEVKGEIDSVILNEPTVF